MTEVIRFRRVVRGGGGSSEGLATAVFIFTGLLLRWGGMSKGRDGAFPHLHIRATRGALK